LLECTGCVGVFDVVSNGQGFIHHLQHGQEVFAKFFNGLVSKGKKTVVAYGAAKFAPGGKGEMAVPTSRACKE
jgi:hypothetical protein